MGLNGTNGAHGANGTNGTNGAYETHETYGAYETHETHETHEAHETHKTNNPNPMLLLSTAYLPPVQWFWHAAHAGTALVELWESYHKQTYRNRCLIDSPQGAVGLTIPVEKPANGSRLIKDMRISDHGDWRNKHWHALESSYFNTPYFEYYQDDFRPIYERRYEFLIDFNEALISKCIELTGISCDLRYTDKYIPAGDITPDRKKTNDLSTQGLSPDRAGISDYRSLISPKINVEDDKDFTPLPYYQVFSERRNGRFLPNLSIADLLFNMGQESLFILSPR